MCSVLCLVSTLGAGGEGFCYWREQVDEVRGSTETIAMGLGTRLGGTHVMLLEEDDDPGEKMKECPERWGRTGWDPNTKGG